MSIDELIKKIEELDTWATPGPWRRRTDCVSELCDSQGRVIGAFDGEHDLTLSTTLRNAVPIILQSLRVAKAVEWFKREGRVHSQYYGQSITDAENESEKLIKILEAAK